MADLNTEQLQAALDRLAENFTGLGSTVDAHSKAISEADDTQKKTERELSKFGLNIEERNKQIQKELDIQEELDKKIKESIPGYDGMTKAQQENIKATKQQETATQDTLKKLKEQNDSIQGLTQEQNAAIAAQLRVNKQKQLEADNTKHQGAAITSAFGQISSSSGILSIAQNAATEKFGATKGGALSVNLAFNALSTAIGFGVLAFDQWKAGLDNAFQAQLAYNQQLVLGADGYKLANSQLLARMQLEAKQTREQSDMWQKVGFGLSITSAGLLAMRSSSFAAALGLTALGGPVTLVITALTALAAAFGVYKAAQDYDLAQAKEAAAQRLALESELRDKLFQTFNDIGNAGMTGAGGMTALGDEAHKAGFALKNIDKFANILKNSQHEISMFGSSAVEGVKNFADVTGEMTEKFGMHFRKLGIDQEAQAASTEKYMALQARLGLLQGKTTAEQAAGAAKYLEELDKTATMLGQSRKEQEDSRAAIMAIEQGQAAMMAAREKGDTARENELDRAIKAASAIQKMDPRVAAGLMKIVSSRGAAVDEDTVKALQSIPKTIADVRKGTGTEFSRGRGAVGELGRTYQSTAENYAATGADMGLTGGYYGEALKQLTRKENQDAEARKIAAQTGVKEGTPAFEKILEKISTRDEAADKATKEAAELAKAQQAKAIAADTELLPFLKKMSGAVDGMTAGMTTFSTSLASSSGIMGGAATTIMRASMKLYNYAFRGTEGESANLGMKIDDKSQEIDNIAARKKQVEEKIKKGDTSTEAKEELEVWTLRLKTLENQKAQLVKQRELTDKKVAIEDMMANSSAQLKEKFDAQNANQNVLYLAKQRELATEYIEIEKKRKSGADITKDLEEYNKKQKALLNMQRELLEKQTAEKEALYKKEKAELEKANTDLALAKANKLPIPAASTPSTPSTPGTASALAGGSTISSSNEQLKDAGLRIKTGDVQKEGSKIDPKLLEIAKQAQANIPGFLYFSGFNDQFHQENSPGSQHTKGLAFDFTVNPGRGKTKPSKEDSEKIMSMLQGMGLSNVINEYDNPSSKATGGHFHAELAMPKAYDGGVFDGPKAGYPVELHGREAIVPMPDPSSKIKIETNSPNKEALSSVMLQGKETSSSLPDPSTKLKMESESVNKETLSSVVNSSTNSVVESNTNTVLNDMMADLYEMMSSKMDDMIDKLSEGNTYSDKLVKAMA